MATGALSLVVYTASDNAVMSLLQGQHRKVFITARQIHLRTLFNLIRGWMLKLEVFTCLFYLLQCVLISLMWPDPIFMQVHRNNLMMFLYQHLCKADAVHYTDTTQGQMHRQTHTHIHIHYTRHYLVIW